MERKTGRNKERIEVVVDADGFILTIYKTIRKLLMNK